MWGRLVGRWRGSFRLVRGRPPYLEDCQTAPVSTAPITKFSALSGEAPDRPVDLDLPGETVRLQPGEERTLFQRQFADTETLLALHRFAWLPLQHGSIDPRWVMALWRAWRDAHGRPDESWAWHPYTSAERVINLLDHARRHGLPGPVPETVALLARHGDAILDRLEYFGERYTGNHLSNNGRGLFRLGIALGLDTYADVGGRILIEEASRIFAPSGVLREGSSHYHLLITRNYVDAWLAARAHGRPETGALERITTRALAVVPHLTLPGGMPLIGDISPDSPPQFLAGLRHDANAGAGWTSMLTPGDRAALATSWRSAPRPSANALGKDGWWRVDTEKWAGLWHVAPDGWSPMPGHGHQDLGAFEVHFGDTALFVDPGRGAYGEDDEATGYTRASAHNSLTVDDADPAPVNRPYYDDRFRQRVLGPPPAVARNADGIRIDHHGFARLGGVGSVSRQWNFRPDSFAITDSVEGRGRHVIRRWFHTTHQVTATVGGAVIEGEAGRFRLRCEGEATVRAGKRWTAYGVWEPASVICMTQRATLPLRTTLTVERQ